jgi:hypothetical protein
MTNAIPEGWHSVTPRLVVSDPDRLGRVSEAGVRRDRRPAHAETVPDHNWRLDRDGQQMNARSGPALILFLNLCLSVSICG